MNPSESIARAVVADMFEANSNIGVWDRDDFRAALEKHLQVALAKVEVFLEMIHRVEQGAAKQLKYMTEPEIGEHLANQLRFIRASQTEDTVGSMLIIFQQDGITQYGATVDPETAPQALRELADRIEQRQTVKR